MNGLLRRYCVLPRYTLFPREIFRRDEEDRRRRCRGHRRGGLTTYPAEKIRGTAGVVRGLRGLDATVRLLSRYSFLRNVHSADRLRGKEDRARDLGCNADAGDSPQDTRTEE